MKFGFISNLDRLPWGGSEELWSATAALMLEQGHTAVACVHDWGATEAAPLNRLAALGMRFHRRSHPPQPTTLGLVVDRIAHRLHLRQPKQDATETFAVERPDMTLVNLVGGFPYQGICGMLARAHLPYVILVQSAAESAWPNDAARREAISLLEPAKAVLFVSEGNRRLVARQLAYEHPRTLVVRNPFRVDYNAALAWPTSAVPMRLAFVGRLEPDAKGCDLALETLARPAWKNRDITLTFFGTGQAEQGVRALADRLGLGPRVRFAGHVANVVSIWQEHHALLLPSRYEGLPLAMVEAMLCSRPCIVTNIAGNAEFITEGRTGFLAAYPTVDAVDDALNRAWEARTRWQAMGAEAARIVRQLVPPSPAGRMAELLLAFARPDETGQQ